MGQTREGFFPFKTFRSQLDIIKIDHEFNRLGRVEWSDRVSRVHAHPSYGTLHNIIASL